MRTFRVPNDPKMINRLPIGMEQFPLFRVANYIPRVAPGKWRSDGYFIPVWDQEALCVSFSRPVQPMAVMVGVDRFNAVSGEEFSYTLSGTPQNYLVVPTQGCLDRFKRPIEERSRLCQFIAPRRGGASQASVLHLAVFEPKVHLTPMPRLPENKVNRKRVYHDPYLADGQPILQTWEDNPKETIEVYLVNTRTFTAITGEEPPLTPITYQTYERNKFPWPGMSPSGVHLASP